MKEQVRILLVEDHADSRRMLQRWLHMQGFETTTADCVAAARRCLETAEFDVILSDIGLPDGTGWELIEELSARHPVKAIALSGFGTAEDIQRSLAAGFAVHLSKPFHPLELLHEVRRLLTTA